MGSLTGHNVLRCLEQKKCLIQTAPMDLCLTFIKRKRKIKTLVNSVIHFTQTSFWKYIRSQLLVYFLTVPWNFAVCVLLRTYFRKIQKVLITFCMQKLLIAEMCLQRTWVGSPSPKSGNVQLPEIYAPKKWFSSSSSHGTIIQSLRLWEPPSI